MGLLTLLDSRTHRNLKIWKKVVRFVLTITKVKAFHVKR
jgi:hypothetical protein